MAAEKKIDWERIEPEWRAGIKSILQIAAEYEEKTGVKVSHTAINKHFKKLGVPRDLSAKIRAKADAMVSAAMVSGVVSTETKMPEVVIINDNATIVANVQISHRKDATRARTLAMSLLTELEGQTTDKELFAQLGELLHSPDDKGVDKLNELYQKVISLPSRVDSMKKLGETLKNLIAIEREAFGIAAEPPKFTGSFVIQASSLDERL